jgi:hypothetical protein
MIEGAKSRVQYHMMLVESLVDLSDVWSRNDDEDNHGIIKLSRKMEEYCLAAAYFPNNTFFPPPNNHQF